MEHKVGDPCGAQVFDRARFSDDGLEQEQKGVDIKGGNSEAFGNGVGDRHPITQVTLAKVPGHRDGNRGGRP